MPAFDFPLNPTLNDTYTANDVTYVCTGTNPSVWKKLGSDTSVGTNKVAIIRHIEASGDNGGQATTAKTAFNTRKLNDLSDNDIGIVLSNNIFSLPAGTYKIDFTTPFYHTSASQSRLKYSNQSDVVSGTLSYINGSSVYCGPGSGGETVGESDGHGIITLTETNYFILESKVAFNPGSYDFGVASNYNGDFSGTTATQEVYSYVRIEDLSTVFKLQDVGTTKVAILKDEKNSQVDSGDFQKEDWRDRDLTVKEDPSNFVNLTVGGSKSSPSTGNTPGYWSLPAGKYSIDWTAPAFEVGRHKTRLVYSTTLSHISTAGLDASASFVDGSTALSSTPGFTDDQSSSFGHTVIELAQTTYFKILHYGIDQTSTNLGFGYPMYRSITAIPTVNPGSNVFTQVRIEDLATAVKLQDPGTTKIAIIQDEKNNNIPAGEPATLDAWLVRDLNTISDPYGVGITSTSNGEFSLPAGTYAINISAPGYHCGLFQARLSYNTNSNFSGTTNYVYGSSQYSGQGTAAGNYIYSQGVDRSRADTVMTLSSTTYFRVEQNIEKKDVGADEAYGVAANRGVKEVYTQVRVQDLATVVKEQDVGTTKVAVLKDQKNATVGSGTGATNTWIDRDITVKTDPQNFVTLNPRVNGQTTASTATLRGQANGISYFSLPAGTYKIKFRATGYFISQHQAAMVYSSTENTINKVYATTDNVTKIYGTSETSTNNSTSSDSTGSEVITINQTTYFKVIHYTVSTFGASDFGQSGSPDKNVYLEIEVEDLATAVKTSEDFDDITVSNNLNIGGDIGLKHDDSGILGEITGGGIYKRVIEIDDSAQGNSQYVDQIQALFRIGQVHGSYAGTLYVTINDQYASMSKVYHFVTTAGGSGAYDRIRTIAGTTVFGTMNFGAGIKYISTYSRDLCVRINYTKSTTQNGPISPKISATLILAQNSVDISVEKPNQAYSTSSGLTVTAETIPSASSSAGMKGEMASDSNYLYVCTDTNTWKRIALSSY